MRSTAAEEVKDSEAVDTGGTILEHHCPEVASGCSKLHVSVLALTYCFFSEKWYLIKSIFLQQFVHNLANTLHATFRQHATQCAYTLTPTTAGQGRAPWQGKKVPGGPMRDTTTIAEVSVMPSKQSPVWFKNANQDKININLSYMCKHVHTKLTGQNQGIAN